MGYIKFDVDKIKDFVFESYKPVEVTGASEMIKLLDESGDLLEKDFREKFPGVKMDVIYARGGGGLLQVDGRDEDVCHWLVEVYEKKVIGSRLSVAYCAEQDNFPATLALLNYKLRAEKNQKPLLISPLKPVEFSKDESQRRCSACGKQTAIKKIEISPTEDIHYCEMCAKKRDAGKELKDNEKPVNTAEDLLNSIPGVKNSTYLLMIYGDLNKAGDLFASIKDKNQLCTLSNQIFITLEEARKEMEKNLWAKKFKSLMPVAGGDDLIIFIHPAAFALVKDTLFKLEDKLQKATGKELKMNFSFLAAKQNFPIYHLFKTSEVLLKETKKQYYQKENHQESFYGFIWMEEGSFRPSGKDVYRKEEFSALYDYAHKIHSNKDISTSSLHQLLELLPVSEKEKEINHPKPEEQFNISYLLSRHDALAEILVPDNSGFRVNTEKNLPLTRDLWEDVIDMRELFMDHTNKEEAE